MDCPFVGAGVCDLDGDRAATGLGAADLGRVDGLRDLNFER